MKTWDDWSDFEINCSVAIAQGCDVVVELAPSSSSVYCGYEGLESTQDERDYCNNPADMWPIMISHNIIVAKLTKSDGYAAIGGYFLDENYEPCSDEIVYVDKKPLRAAAIVFLIMNGVTPE